VIPNGNMSAWLLRLRLGILIGFGFSLGGRVEAGVVNDPSGDASGHAHAVSISGRLASGNLFLTATFSNGSLNPTNLGFIFGFDTDQNPNTGVQPPASFPLGADYSTYFNSAADPNNAMTSGACPISVPVTFGSNTLSLSIPLSALGNDDGIMGFGLIVGVPNGAMGFFPYDTVPNSASGGPLGGLTSPVPELKIRLNGGAVVVSWDARATNYVFESSPVLGTTAVWSGVTNNVTTAGGEASITNSNVGQMKFYRMRL
jgi:hypothetical protein